MTLQPLLDHRLAVVGGIVQIQDEPLGLGVSLSQQPQQVDELLAVDVVSGQPQVQVFLVVGAIRPQDVQPFATAAHAHQKPLPDQQPAGIDQVQPPDRMAGIHEIPPRVACPSASWPSAAGTS